MYHIKFTGDIVEEGDWVVWVRNDHESGSTACQGAAQLAASSVRNDFVHGADDADNPGQDDVGGLVRRADIDHDGMDDLFSDVELLSGVDGRVDPTPYNNDAR